MGEYILTGLKHGGYVVGLIVSLGGFAALVALVCTVVGYLVNPDKDDNEEGDE